METLQTYKGQVHNGQPVISGNAVLPENATVYVTVVSTAIYTEPPSKTRDITSDDNQAQRDAFEKFFAAIAKIDDEALDEEFDAILAKKVNITRELNL